MKVCDLDRRSLQACFTHGQLRLRTGPFVVRLQADSSLALAPALNLLYANAQLESRDCIADFHIRLRRPGSLRRWVRPQVVFERDGKRPFMPFPADHALPLFEWGLNWCVSTRAHQYLLLHAAAVEHDGCAVLLPAWPGSGKSTLAAALMHRGWRLLSDEFGVVRPCTRGIIPFPRPIPLKNESIEVIWRYAPDAVRGPIFPKTRKGNVAHLAPTRDSIDRAHQVASPVAVVFPAYKSDTRTRLRSVTKARAFMKLAGNAFNYELLGESAFEAVAGIISECESVQLQYQDLDEAIESIERLVT